MHTVHLQTAATHTNRDLKRSIVVSWTAPPPGAGPIGFRYEVIKFESSKECFALLCYNNKKSYFSITTSNDTVVNLQFVCSAIIEYKNINS